MRKAVLITGAAGGIGTALTKSYANAGWQVIATGRKLPEAQEHISAFVPCDLMAIATDDNALDLFKKDIEDHLDKNKLDLSCLVNNAALQVLGSTDELSGQQMTDSFAVNAIAPFRLVQAFLPRLEANTGSVVNIGTVHAQSTKKGFVAYAASKTAIHGLTRALAVDLGGRIRVNCLAPAATETPMLEAGFKGREEAYRALAEAHPVGRIADPMEVGRTAVFLSSDDAGFITGATLYIDGGVLSRLHDPV